MTEKFLSWVQIEKDNNYFHFFIYYNISSTRRKTETSFSYIKKSH